MKQRPNPPAPGADAEPRPKILVVDDQEPNLLAARTILARLPVEVLTARSGDQALTLLLRHEFAVILLDVRMPGMDGFETAALIRDHTAKDPVPIVFLTAEAAEQHAIFQGYESGAVDYLLKPIDEVLLLAKLRVFLELHRRKRKLQEEMAATARLNQQLENARREADAAAQAKAAFLANMSHEIRTPMNAIVGMTELLQETSLDARQREFVGTIGSSGAHLLTVINDILDFSKIESGKLQIEAREFDLRRCVEDALDMVARGAAEKHVELAYVHAPGTPEHVIGDASRVRQILANYLSNAVKFTDRGEIVVTVSARPLGDRFEITFSVRDTGMGIPSESIAHLFQSFTQVDASITRNYGGTGLGLAICKRLAELMGGRVGVHSAEGQGSTFHFSVVASAAQPAQAPGADRALEGRRVLVVDDNDTVCGILRTHAERWGMEVGVASNGDEALAWAGQGRRWDLVIVDAALPGVGAAALAQALRERGGSPSPVLVQAAPATHGLDAITGFDAILRKPIHLSSLYDNLLGAVHGRPMPTAVPPRDDAPRSPAAPLRILLAEDNPVNQKVAVLMLEKLGYTGVRIAVTGLEVLQLLEQEPFDIVLMDMQMPVMDGLEATRRLREQLPPARQPFVLALTANALAGDSDICLAAGMDDYLAKPFTRATLEQALARAALGRAGRAG